MAEKWGHHNPDIETLHLRPKSWSERCYGIIRAIKTILLVALGLLSFLLYHDISLIAKHGSLPLRDSTSGDVCLTAECVLAASTLLRNRSPNHANIDPCDDFHTYMCEGYEQTHDIRSDQSTTGTFNQMSEDGQTLLRHILEAPFPNALASGDDAEDDKKNFEKLQNGYRACMNESGIEKRGFSPLSDVIAELLNIDEEIASTEQDGKKLAHMLAYLSSIGVDPLLSLGIQASQRSNYCFSTLLTWNRRLTKSIPMTMSYTSPLPIVLGCQPRSIMRTRTLWNGIL